MKLKTFLPYVLLSVLALVIAGSAQSASPSTDSMIETIRADFRADKVALITEAMKLSEHDSKIFWPVYRRYDSDLMAVNDQRVALIKSYADKFGTIKEADAKSMIDQALDFEAKRTQLKKKYANEFQKAGLSAMTTAKFLQLEHRLDLLVDLKLASELPALLVQAPAPVATTK